ncbi:hypothetical protein MLD38_013086 [Melastoma candidum]|uniref:Uncharacterized protein n=1 Tax=Melastoma candidum TaxID=119954 RepID=A0ACB9R9P1_9MYRT|nr:hypothetical protein MLD38_013086 [Melastoma candidum]
MALEIASDRRSNGTRMKRMMVASIAAGVQFGWALQLSLLTPYVQLLGIPHKHAAIIWLCGPISGMLVQPFVGYYSDRATSKFGRRSPFIAAGALLVALAVFLIGYAADLGHLSGDQLGQTPMSHAIIIFIAGFWILDVANNMLQGPCRALLADLSGGDQRKTGSANAFFSFFMAVGNVAGFAAGSYTDLYKVMPFTQTAACNVYCANLKTCFFISIALLLTLTVVALTIVREQPPSSVDDIDSSLGNTDPEHSSPFCVEIMGAFRDLKRPMWVLLLVTCLNWVAWFPFLLFDTDWMGKEVYGGNVGAGDGEAKLYDMGVRAGALGLMLNSIVLGVSSLAIQFQYAGTSVRGVKKLWGAVNFLLALCLVMTVLVTKLAQSHRKHDKNGHLLPPPPGIKAAALTLFAILGIPQAVTYSVPFALASMFSNSSGAGQGLSLGVLNLAIVVPQMVISVASGPFDELFGGGNLPAFVLGAVAAAVSGILALTMLPSPPPEAPLSEVESPTKPVSSV